MEMKMTDTHKASRDPSSSAPADSEVQMKMDGETQPEPYGLDAIPPECNAFFLVHGESDFQTRYTERLLPCRVSHDTRAIMSGRYTSITYMISFT